ncbi:MAG: helix-turn-helix domain-containing protein [Candidatus Treponema excrementipullorum]|nr:helix-turn-helix domain-containing protein [Candidatus Treponema excrementipullorum]
MKDLAEEIQGLPVILDSRDLMTFLRISRRGLYRILKDKELHAFRDEDGEWNVLRDDLERWIEKNQ